MPYRTPAPTPTCATCRHREVDWVLGYVCTGPPADGTPTLPEWCHAPREPPTPSLWQRLRAILGRP